MPRNNFNPSNNLKKGIRSSVNGGLKNVEPSEKRCEQLHAFNLPDMTSKELLADFRANYLEHSAELHDAVYIGTWKTAIMDNPHLFTDKIVLDVRCGLGTLSMFSALAGAKHVYANENSNVTQWTERIIHDNNLCHKVTVFRGTANEIELPVQQVDVIVSSFLGQSLLIENGLNELIDARDKWLAPNGLMFPDRYTLYIAALDDDLRRNRSNFWRSVYSFDMRALVGAVCAEPYTLRVKQRKMMTAACPVKHMNLYNLQKQDFKEFDSYFCLEVIRDGSFCTYFDIEFTECREPLKFTMESGGPFKKAWFHLVFVLNFHGKFPVKAMDEVYGTFGMSAISDDFKNIDWNIFVIHKHDNGGFRKTWTYQTRI